MSGNDKGHLVRKRYRSKPSREDFQFGKSSSKKENVLQKNISVKHDDDDTTSQQVVNRLKQTETERQITELGKQESLRRNDLLNITNQLQSYGSNVDHVIAETLKDEISQIKISLQEIRARRNALAAASMQGMT
ncbi:hypothetical protein GUITHDRAFT_113082 [Guillardia theta CCMP2712]|uniref:Uncharacterized protein n=1 Tax=Guillardia theta (strain CCMP2712) TaxID=905079 RepID=L1IY68_GUITC|nr:hypothetical protein GUITHDRAFT_113082 [Guillardia theta CCMP2712]EKX40814.1 hypothetical protein GUITHDRAFT_113082 [Guillardia theta CCMP2712]|eukprot:XP_005827794.1 hypothetical protein GUITHDRAFT_113082 [Guillardia theta CCMP2712]